MDLPPQTAGEEAKLEELAGAHRELAKVPTVDVDRDDVLRLLDDTLHAQLVAPVHHRRSNDAEGDQQDGRDRVQRHPVGERHGIVDEVGSGRQLVGEAEHDREVDEKVDEMPALVGESPARRPHREDRDEDEEGRADVGHQHVGVGGQEGPGLSGEGAAIGERVAGGGEDDVSDDQVDGGEAQPAVPARDPVDPEEAVEPGASRHQHHLDERGVGAQQGAELTHRDQHRGRVGQMGKLPVASPQNDDQGGIAADRQDHVARAQSPAAGNAQRAPGGSRDRPAGGARQGCRRGGLGHDGDAEPTG